MKICVILGTRPEIIKMQPIIEEITKRNHQLLFIHTGQHFDLMMSDIFLKELRIKTPDYFLRVKTDTQGIQIGQIISSSEDILLKEKPDVVLVQGDTNSALGSSITAAKINIPIGHVEAGCRSFDLTMSEEINRVLISDIASLNFAPTQNCVSNLEKEGISSTKIFLTGHPLVDLLSNINMKSIESVLPAIGCADENYYLLTLHRRENIESEHRLVEILSAMDRLSQKIPLVFPCHPHTYKQIRKFNAEKYLKNIKTIGTVGYFDSLSLIKHSRVVLSDSGGIQQESAILGTPCVTLRDVTEWIETVESGTNILAGYKDQNIVHTVGSLEDNYDNVINRIKKANDLFGHPGAARRILDVIEYSLK
ncbi:MAG: UDP-N-acetylglucosamine 2-epimerase (non-hydrolyzing) [Candidatus Nitrosocosmicus sp.]|nr:UDP-N-acetylglucosamine 2-epimerase (non-hydrolyzing) [Candidatus Nitrosocosmicus sp.]